MRRKIFLISCLSYMCTTVLFSQKPDVRLIEQTFIFDTAPFKACHASTIVKMKNHTLLSAWFGGSYEGNPDVGIWLSRNEGNGWQQPVKAADGKSDGGKIYACWNPVLFNAKSGVLYLHYKTGPNPREWQAMYKTSNDNGNTWSAAKPLPMSYLGPVKNKPVLVSDDAILYPSSIESRDEKHWTVHLEWSDTSLNHWKKTEIDCDTFQAIQPSLLLYSEQDIQLLTRSKENVIAQSWSHDGGLTWSRLSATKLANPNSGIDAASINDSAHILVYNPLLSGKDWWEGRSVLKIAFSKDGIEWKDVYTLENETKGEYSYPAVIAEPSGDVYITYTYNRKKIRFVHLKMTP